MKLAIVVTEFPSVTETFIVRDVKKFIDAGHDVRLFHLTPYNDQVLLHEIARPVDSIAETRPFLLSWDVLRAFGRTLLRRPKPLLSIVSRIVARCWREPVYMLKSLIVVPKTLWFAESIEEWGADHIHGEFAGHPATVSWMIGRLTGIPFSFSCRAHDIFVTQALLEDKIVESAFVRTISEYNIDFLSKNVCGFRADKAHVIHSSIDLEAIKHTQVVRGEVFRVLYVGSLEQRKGVDDLLHALSRLKGPWTCLIIGDGSERASLKRLNRQLGLEGRVTFLGAQPFQEVSKAYREADVVAAPSKIGHRGRTEGIPNVVIEALGYGRPVVTSKVSGIPELVRDGETGLLIEPGDVEALVTALKRLQHDPDFGLRMAVAGRRAVEAEFDLSINAKRQLALFAEHSAEAKRA